MIRTITSYEALRTPYYRLTLDCGHTTSSTRPPTRKSTKAYCGECSRRVLTGEALAVRLILDNMELAESHATAEIGDGLTPVREELAAGRYERAAVGMDFFTSYWNEQDPATLTDDERIALRHLTAAQAQCARLSRAGNKRSQHCPICGAFLPLTPTTENDCTRCGTHFDNGEPVEPGRILDSGGAR